MFPEATHKGRCKRERHIYVDNGTPVLLVAHIDTVQSPRYISPSDGAGFDDRLGVYCTHQLVTTYPTWFDLLLTDYEESFGSTAQYFVPSHDYNFVVELDREGEDYVDYGLASEDFHKIMEQYGFTKSLGSYTDIVEMDHIKVSKVNIGIGVSGSHSLHSSFDPGVMYRQLDRLLALCADYKDQSFPCDRAATDRLPVYLYGGTDDDMDFDSMTDWPIWHSRYRVCPLCGDDIQKSIYGDYCPSCCFTI